MESGLGPLKSWKKGCHIFDMYMFPAFIYIIIVYCQTQFGMVSYIVIKYITITWKFMVKVTDSYATRSCDFNRQP